MAEKTRRIAFDIEEMRPGCVLLQAILGGHTQIAHEFETRDWLLEPTPGLRVYEVTKEQLAQLVVKVETNRETD
jgi:hypothetical protein